MDTTRYATVMGLAAGALFALAPQSASAQTNQSSFALDAGGGLVLPVGEFADYVEEGYTLEAGASYWFNQRWAVRLHGAVDFFDTEGEEVQQEVEIPDVNIWYVGAGLEFDLMNPANMSPWHIDLSAGGGAATVDTDSYESEPGVFQSNIQETYPYVFGGVEVGYELSPNLRLEVGAKTRVVFVDEEDMQPLVTLNSAADPTDQFFTLPLTIGLRWDIPRGR